MFKLPENEQLILNLQKLLYLALSTYTYNGKKYLNKEALECHQVGTFEIFFLSKQINLTINYLRRFDRLYNSSKIFKSKLDILNNLSDKEARIMFTRYIANNADKAVQVSFNNVIAYSYFSKDNPAKTQKTKKFFTVARAFSKALNLLFLNNGIVPDIQIRFLSNDASFKKIRLHYPVNNDDMVYVTNSRHRYFRTKFASIQVKFCIAPIEIQKALMCIHPENTSIPNVVIEECELNKLINPWGYKAYYSNITNNSKDILKILTKKTLEKAWYIQKYHNQKYEMTITFDVPIFERIADEFYDRFSERFPELLRLQSEIESGETIISC